VQRDLPLFWTSHSRRLSDVKDFLQCSFPNSAEEYSEVVVDLYDATAGLHFLYPFLTHNRSKTLNLRCGIWNERLRS
jgi:hypothetical protein